MTFKVYRTNGPMVKLSLNDTKRLVKKCLDYGYTRDRNTLVYQDKKAKILIGITFFLIPVN